ncbi:hypothetical protein RQP46_007911 [Phenoliferia psychrophenolica]
MENRKGKEVPSGDDIGGVTSNLRAQLQQFGSYATMVNTQLKDVNQLHSELEDGKPLPIVKPRLDRAYDEVERSAKEEIDIFTTTIKSIIPLPGKHDKYIHPLGAAVMALYPDTDSFYRAVIVSGPEIEKGKKKERAYNLRFDDDEGAIRRIPVEMVVELP